ncbi:hypothetical protein TNIN_114361 [Trichonephila inaurata madagascariensis]|uniref:Uncharacterized protein n=1 Tax=Trichonephila inaurata madagascariensis TaxID=2747483 RepID=A0A8X6ISF5_9ARAC|nr:hypothetical protein TNIN_114361 [Trichonephila inaurata madagascariensis]
MEDIISLGWANATLGENLISKMSTEIAIQNGLLSTCRGTIRNGRGKGRGTIRNEHDTTDAWWAQRRRKRGDLTVMNMSSERKTLKLMVIRIAQASIDHRVVCVLVDEKNNNNKVK